MNDKGQKAILTVGGNWRVHVCLKYVLPECRHVSCPLGLGSTEFLAVDPDCVVICRYTEKEADIRHIVAMVKRFRPLIPIIMFVGEPEKAGSELKGVITIPKPEVIAVGNAVRNRLGL